MLKAGGVEELAVGGVQSSLLKLLLSLLLVGWVLPYCELRLAAVLVMFEMMLALLCFPW